MYTALDREFSEPVLKAYAKRSGVTNAGKPIEGPTKRSTKATTIPAPMGTTNPRVNMWG